MRSILEQAVLHHLNGEDDRATELFHKFIVGKARQIHESMRDGGEAGEGDFEDAMSEEYFGDGDLSELEDNNDDALDGDEFGGEIDDAEGELDADLGGEGDFEAGEGEEGEEEFDLGGDAAEEGGEVSAEEIADLKSQLEELTREFADLKADLGDEDGSDDDFGDADLDAPAVEDDASSDDVDDEDEDGEPFQAMGESITSELDKIEVNLKADGKQVAAGDTITQNRKSPLPVRKAADRQAGKPVTINSKDHKHFNRETAPTVATMKARRNTMNKSTETLSPVKK